MITSSDVMSRFKQFSKMDALDVDFAIQEAALLMGEPSRWEPFYDMAMFYLVGHLLVIADKQNKGDSAANAPIKKREVDGVMVERAVEAQKMVGDELLTTSYGKRYHAYRHMLFTGVYST